jgi:cation transport ATPase
MAGIIIDPELVAAKNTGEKFVSCNNLVGISKAIKLGRKTYRIVRQNLFLAFVCSVVLIPVAAGVFTPFEVLPSFLKDFHPILPVLVIVVGSISIVINSLRHYYK